jgi:hypothetical protein
VAAAENPVEVVASADPEQIHHKAQKILQAIVLGDDPEITSYTRLAREDGELIKEELGPIEALFKSATRGQKKAIIGALYKSFKTRSTVPQDLAVEILSMPGASSWDETGYSRVTMACSSVLTLLSMAYRLEFTKVAITYCFCKNREIWSRPTSMDLILMAGKDSTVAELLIVFSTHFIYILEAVLDEYSEFPGAKNSIVLVRNILTSPDTCQTPIDQIPGMLEECLSADIDDVTYFGTYMTKFCVNLALACRGSADIHSEPEYKFLMRIFGDKDKVIEFLEELGIPVLPVGYIPEEIKTGDLVPPLEG